jgi:hypothetical protein
VGRVVETQDKEGWAEYVAPAGSSLIRGVSFETVKPNTRLHIDNITLTYD